MLKLLSPAKLNLFLHITGRRPDGYHNLQTLFQLLDFGDDMTFSPNSNGQLQLRTQFDEVTSDDNLVIKAANLLRRHTGCNLGADITLEKRIPTGAGLGGGSSNAATTLLALNHLWETNVSIETLAELGASLGADVPVFVHGHTAWAEGVGEKLSPVDMPKQHFVVCYPNVHIETAKIFQNKELTRDEDAITLAAFLERGASNSFEKVVRKTYKEVDKALNFMALYAPSKLTGSGSSVFCQFDSEEKAKDVLDKIANIGFCFYATGVNQSPVHYQLS